MKKAEFAAVAAACLAALAGQAWGADTAAAQVTSTSGAVVVLQAGRTAPVTSTTALRAGDRVLAMENGQAQMKFADGCVVSIQPKSIATVGAQSPCAASPLVRSAHPMDFADNEAWEVPLGFLAVAGTYAAVVAAEKSSHQGVVQTPISP
jgi:hypothetical protein